MLRVNEWFANLPGIFRKVALGWSMFWLGTLLLLWWLASRHGELSEDDQNE